MTTLNVPSDLNGFENTNTFLERTKEGHTLCVFEGELLSSREKHTCSKCGALMHRNRKIPTQLKHIPIGTTPSVVRFYRFQYYCPNCGATVVPLVPFQSGNLRITSEMLSLVHFLLSHGFTNLEISKHTGLHKNTVQKIDMARLESLYTTSVIDEKGKEIRRLNKPDKQATFLGIDEFKLHKGHKYATSIIDLNTGHILWLEQGKKKAVVYDFIEHVGLEWMKGVSAVACDMNSDFQEAFQEKCPHIKVVFDYFHIVKNFNDNVISKVRKDEQKRLIKEGNIEGAKALKNTRFILTSSRETLLKRDQIAEEGKKPRKDSVIFPSQKHTPRGGNLSKYEALLTENGLLVSLDIIKEKLHEAFKITNEVDMENAIMEISNLCIDAHNEHLSWFSKFLLSHIDGIKTHATYAISTGKLEGINNKIKTIRRKSYGLPNDDYFFLKLFDASRSDLLESGDSHTVVP